MSRQIHIGNLTLGGGAPVRVQSMTNTDTLDTSATVQQALRMVEAGCELVRITAPDVRAAENLGRIKEELLRRGCEVPLVADIHFNPKAAEVAATLVEKVRVNPGNYTDRNTGKLDFTDQEYNDELKRIGERMASLIDICKRHHTAMRIGTNHGSLSQRIMSRYGNTPEGMAQSALEFAQVCRAQDYHDLVFSMKASNVKVMVDSTRLFVHKMHALGMDYPIHLGVTEAGDGIQGRLKSAAGIGALLLDERTGHNVEVVGSRIVFGCRCDGGIRTIYREVEVELHLGKCLQRSSLDGICSQFGDTLTRRLVIVVA